MKKIFIAILILTSVLSYAGSLTLTNTKNLPLESKEALKTSYYKKDFKWIGDLYGLRKKEWSIHSSGSRLIGLSSIKIVYYPKYPSKENLKSKVIDPVDYDKDYVVDISELKEYKF